MPSVGKEWIKADIKKDKDSEEIKNTKENPQTSASSVRGDILPNILPKRDVLHKKNKVYIK